MTRVWDKPKSICTCKHSGDGLQSSHLNTKYESGHGACKDCRCPQFTWAGFLPEYIQFMNTRLEDERETLL